ncbi:MAG: EscU/YscU/HrcU family type III secretion system export apparatus switch protein [Candidatus Thiodiazotropha sp. (ex Dulcina madagascariensis)]|nr:EscU/YscU/HrcU family type III secretion system export apparatus switch protein [Candidatus Thiodiazotropha sp. (ex Dulcina madagascariensis)]
MADHQQEQDRTEQATPFKLKEARRRGQVAKSLELNSVFIIGIMLGLAYLLGTQMFYKQLDLSRVLLSNHDMQAVSPENITNLFEVMLKELIGISWPYLLAIILTPIAITLMQTGPVFSLFPIKPDFKRINPVEGFKRIFSIRLLYESLKTIVKICLFGMLIYFSIKNALPKMMALVDRDPDTYATSILYFTLNLGFQLFIAMIIIGILDLAYTRWDYAKKMRMSRREVKDEVKRREGDPLIRAKRRELQKEAIKRAGSIRRVPDADVLITNPLRIAVAIKYDRNKMIAPSVIAKGSGDIAKKMRMIARKNGIVIVEKKSLARKLFKKVGIDKPIPEDLYPAVAKILVWYYSINDNRKSLANAVYAG